MARRQRKKKKASSANPMTAIIGAIIALALVAIGFFIMNINKGEKNLPELPASQFQDNPESLRGSDFIVTAKIKENADHNETQGSLIFVDVLQSSKQYTFAFIVPTEVSAKGPNLSNQQSYLFKGTVDSNNRFIVTEYNDK